MSKPLPDAPETRRETREKGWESCPDCGCRVYALVCVNCEQETRMVWIALSSSGYMVPFIGFAFTRKELDARYTATYGHSLKTAGYRLVKARITHEAIDDLLSAATAEAQQGKQDWQPIEIAPKDGTWILVTGHPTGRNRKRWIPASSALWEHGAWSFGCDCEIENDVKITHWMPLPESPVLHAEATR